MTKRWSIQEVARLTGTTSRTLRHYDAIGLLPPASTGANGYRSYDEAALVRLQRILLLRQLGLGLPEIGGIVDDGQDEVRALTGHLDRLREEQQRLARRVASVEYTIARRREGTHLVAEQMFDGFDHTDHREEVEQRWGTDAYARSDSWWRAKSAEEKTAFHTEQRERNAAWVSLATVGGSPAGDEAYELAARHVRWLGSVPGTPASDLASTLEYVRGLGDMYVTDPRFTANFGGEDGARFVREALHAWADRQAAPEPSQPGKK